MPEYLSSKVPHDPKSDKAVKKMKQITFYELPGFQIHCGHLL